MRIDKLFSRIDCREREREGEKSLSRARDRFQSTAISKVKRSSARELTRKRRKTTGIFFCSIFSGARVKRKKERKNQSSSVSLERSPSIVTEDTNR